MIKSKPKPKKKLSFLSTPSTTFHVSTEKERKRKKKSMLANSLEEGQSRESGGGEWKDGVLSIYHNSKLILPRSNHINYQQQKANFFFSWDILNSNERSPPFPL